MLPILALLVFPALVVYAACSDLLTMRIANWLVLALVVAYVVLALVAQRPLAEIGIGFVTAAGVLVLFFAFFAFGWIGGGDAKLVAAITLWLGLELLLPYLLYSALLGGGLTLFVLAARANAVTPLLMRFKWIEWLHNPKAGVPYGIALAIAGLLIYPQTKIFAFFAG